MYVQFPLLFVKYEQYYWRYKHLYKLNNVRHYTLVIVFLSDAIKNMLAYLQRLDKHLHKK